MAKHSKRLQMTASITLIVFCIILVLISFLSFFGTVIYNSFNNHNVSLSPTALIIDFFCFLYGAPLFILAIVGLRKCGVADKAGFFMITGAIFCLVSLVWLITSIIIHIPITVSIISFMLSLLYFIGGLLNKNVITMKETNTSVLT